MKTASENIAAPLGTSPARAERTAHLLRLAAAQRGARRRRLLDEVIRLNLPVARAIARRYGGRGEPLDDLEQVAALGLVKAVRQFDPDRGRDFLSYAVPTMSGEVKRHFRDNAWMVRPPRRVQDLQPKISAAVEQLSGELRRSPTPGQVASFLGEAPEHVIEALASDGCFQTMPLEVSPDTPSGTLNASLADVIGRDDVGYRLTEVRTDLALALEGLSPRERLVLAPRVRDGWTQQRIAHELDVSQMQVSRMLVSIRARLRDAMRAAVA